MAGRFGIDSGAFWLAVQLGLSCPIWPSDLALGWSMVGLSGLIFLPRWLIAGFAMVTIAGHNALDFLRPDDFGSFAWLWTVLHVSGRIELSPGYSFYVDYPLIPWLA